MRRLLLVAALSTLPALSAYAVPYTATLTDGAAIDDTLDSGSGWANGSTFETDFFSFSGDAGTAITANASPLEDGFDLGLSVYRGLDDGFALTFDRDGDFGDLDFLVSNGDGRIDGFVLPQAGDYTLAVGGSTPDFLVDGTAPFDYALSFDSSATAASVPLPTALSLMVGGLAGLVGVRRRPRG